MQLSSFKTAGKKIACSTICHSPSIASWVSAQTASKLFGMARKGEFKIAGFPDFNAAMGELKQFQRSPRPDYQVCVALGDGSLIVKETLREFWSKKPEFTEKLAALLSKHDAEFNPRGLKRGAEVTKEVEAEEQPAKRLRMGTTATSADFEAQHAERTQDSKMSRSFLFKPWLALHQDPFELRKLSAGVGGAGREPLGWSVQRRAHR